MPQKNKAEKAFKEKDEELEKIRLNKVKALVKSSKPRQTLAYPDMPVKVTDRNFDEFIHKYPIIVIDCWADWCGPCHMLAPTIDELAKDYSGKVAFGKLNIDENQKTAMQFLVMSIPTLLLMKNGLEVDRIVGVSPRQYIESKLNDNLT